MHVKEARKIEVTRTSPPLELHRNEERASSESVLFAIEADSKVFTKPLTESYGNLYVCMLRVS
jgi:hypothetical protein